MKHVRTEGFVYIVHAVGTNRIKIGFSANPGDRLASLQTGSPFRLEIISCVPGSRADEMRMHRRLAKYRRTGEWFEIPRSRPPSIIGHRWKASRSGWKLYARQPAISRNGKRSSSHRYIAFYSQKAIETATKTETYQ